jgi:hypothetical protein
MHPRQQCGFVRHGTYARKTPAGTLIARWYCRLGHCTFSLLPEHLAARFPGTLSAIERVVSTVEAAPTLVGCVEQLRPDPVSLPSALRWIHTKASSQLQVARSTAFRWRHRFLALPQHVRAGQLDGIVEADETCILKSCKGQAARRRQLRPKPRSRGGQASIRGMSEEHDIVLVACDRSGGCTDQVVAALDTAHLAAVLQPVLAPDAVLCTDGSPALAAAARHIQVEHHAINLSAGQRVIGPWHTNNVNGYHGRLKNWLRKFNGVASSYLPHYLGWFRALDRFRPAKLPQQPC